MFSIPLWPGILVAFVCEDGSLALPSCTLECVALAFAVGRSMAIGPGRSIFSLVAIAVAVTCFLDATNIASTSSASYVILAVHLEVPHDEDADRIVYASS